MPESSKLLENVEALVVSTAKIDERTKQLLDRQDRTDRNLHEVRDALGGLSNRLSVVEATRDQDLGGKLLVVLDKLHDADKRVTTLELGHAGHADRWKSIGATVWQIAQSTGIAYILYRLGIGGP